MKILFIGPSNKECGVYQYGMRLYKALEGYLNEWCDWELHYAENYTDVNEYTKLLEELQPNVVLYSYHPTATPFAKDYMLGNPNPNIVHIGITHEQEQVIIDNIEKLPQDWFGGTLFNYWIGHDPTIVINKPNCFNATRPILRSEWKDFPDANGKIIFGSSSFGFRRKMHPEIVVAIQKEFDEAIIRFNMPPSFFGDKDLSEAKQIENECRAVITKPGIELQITNTLFETEEEIVEWLYGNHVNIYFFEQQQVPFNMRGVSSSPDNALSTRRPLIVNHTSMMRHLVPYLGGYGPIEISPKATEVNPHFSISTEGNMGNMSIKQMLDKQTMTGAGQLIYNEWTPTRMAGEYYRIIKQITK
jgi:hypothetical protein